MSKSKFIKITQVLANIAKFAYYVVKTYLVLEP